MKLSTNSTKAAEFKQVLESSLELLRDLSEARICLAIQQVAQHSPELEDASAWITHWIKESLKFSSYSASAKSFELKVAPSFEYYMNRPELWECHNGPTQKGLRVFKDGFGGDGSLERWVYRKFRINLLEILLKSIDETRSLPDCSINNKDNGYQDILLPLFQDVMKKCGATYEY